MAVVGASVATETCNVATVRMQSARQLVQPSLIVPASGSDQQETAIELDFFFWGGGGGGGGIEINDIHCCLPTYTLFFAWFARETTNQLSMALLYSKS